MTEKEQILKLIQEMPEDTTTDDVMEALYLREVVERGRADIAAGRVVTLEEAKKRLTKWLER
jgi:predicted transcriptional regulator